MGDDPTSHEVEYILGPITLSHVQHLLLFGFSFEARAALIQSKVPLIWLFQNKEMYVDSLELTMVQT